MELNRDPLFPHLCHGGWFCAICRWLRRQEMLDQFYRERHSEKAGESA